jgi:hypothetical protein
VFLIIDMLRRIRRAGYRADVNEQLDAEAQAQAEDATARPMSTIRTSIPARTAPVAELTAGGLLENARETISGTPQDAPRGDDRVERDEQTRRPVAEEREHRAHVEDLVEAEVARPRVRLLQRVADRAAV